eukprot:scaffold4277_cov50-Attheya_sp.AAC.1
MLQGVGVIILICGAHVAVTVFVRINRAIWAFLNLPFRLWKMRKKSPSASLSARSIQPMHQCNHASANASMLPCVDALIT